MATLGRRGLGEVTSGRKPAKVWEYGESCAKARGWRLGVAAGRAFEFRSPGGETKQDSQQSPTPLLCSQPFCMPTLTAQVVSWGFPSQFKA